MESIDCGCLNLLRQSKLSVKSYCSKINICLEAGEFAKKKEAAKFDFLGNEFPVFGVPLPFQEQALGVLD